MIPLIYFTDIECDANQDPVIVDENDEPIDQAPTQICPCLVLEWLGRGVVIRHRWFGRCYLSEDFN
jgi:hypothetical protein